MAQPIEDFESWFNVFGTHNVDAVSGKRALFACQKEWEDSGVGLHARW